jgi:peptidyl-prolyl cis-trans isomerase SurA
MNRRVLAGLLGMALAGCAQTRSDLPLARGGPVPVGLEPLPSIHKTINDGSQFAPASLVLRHEGPGSARSGPINLPRLPASGSEGWTAPASGPAPGSPWPRMAAPPQPAAEDAGPPGPLPPLPPEAEGAAPPVAVPPPVDQVTRTSAPGGEAPAAPAAAPPRGKTASETVARIGDDIITFNELRTAVEDRLRDMPAGQQPTREELNRAGAMMLDRLIDRTVIIQQARRELKNPKAWDLFQQQADETWKKDNLPILLKQTGAADEHELKSKLAERGMSLDDMRAAFRLDTIAREYLRMKLMPKLKVDLLDLREYYTTHQAEFDRPAQVSWREVQVTYDKHPDHAEARRKAEAMFDRLRRGGDFAAMARAESEGATAAQGGLWETSPGSYAVAAVNQALDTLPLNQVSPIIEGDAGLHIVRVEARRRAGPAPFQEVQFAIRDRLSGQKFQKEMAAYLEKLRARTPIRTVFDGTESDPNTVRSGQSAAPPATASITPRALPAPAAPAPAPELPEIPDLPKLDPEAQPAQTPPPAEAIVLPPDLPL